VVDGQFTMQAILSLGSLAQVSGYDVPLSYFLGPCSSSPGCTVYINATSFTELWRQTAFSLAKCSFGQAFKLVYTALSSSVEWENPGPREHCFYLTVLF
jgi:hypothetical protein